MPARYFQVVGWEKFVIRLNSEDFYFMLGPVQLRLKLFRRFTVSLAGLRSPTFENCGSESRPGCSVFCTNKQTPKCTSALPCVLCGSAVEDSFTVLTAESQRMQRIRRVTKKIPRRKVTTISDRRSWLDHGDEFLSLPSARLRRISRPNFPKCCSADSSGLHFPNRANPAQAQLPHQPPTLVQLE